MATETNANSQATFPSLSDRVQSTLIDTVFIIVLMFGCASLLDNINNPPDWLRVTMFISIWLIYDPLCTTLGCTLGNYIKGIRVRKNYDTNKKINFIQAIIRYIIKVLLGWISFLTIHSSPQRRALHDIVAGSVVINKS